MCGIAGVLAAPGRAASEAGLWEMARALRHRGPDESAVWREGGVGFAHTRLSIIDVRTSHQPMQSVDGAWTLVFNGEIFNYRELRKDLDYPFTTEGDTEVLLAGLARHGIGFVRRLRGQFAFAAMHRDSDVLHLVRDRLGVLPLYYRHDRNGLVFGSEIKAIHGYASAARQVDLDSLDAYLTGGSVPAPHTLFRGISKLEAAHRVEVAAGGPVTIHQYWELPEVEPRRRSAAPQVIEEADRAIRDAVGASLVADVPVGSYLSGGVDSSLIVAIMKDLRGAAPVETFAAGFGDPRFDELTWARRVSENLDTNHHEVVVRPADFLELWPKLTWHRDAPVSQPADMAVFRLAQLAKQHVTVVLSGEGGDELFGGYPKYRFAPWHNMARRIPVRWRGALARHVGSLLPQQLSRPRTALRALCAPSELEQLSTWFAPFTMDERSALLGGAPSPERQRAVPSGVNAVDRMLRHDVASWLPDNLLERGDRMSMAASLELRPPLLDHRLVEFAFRLPPFLKVRPGVTKWLLKEVAKRYLPTEIVDRRKVGFRVPLEQWFRSDLRDTVWDRLTGGAFVSSTLDHQVVLNLLKRHDSGRFNEESRIWSLLSLEVWYEVCVSDQGACGPL